MAVLKFIVVVFWVARITRTINTHRFVAQKARLLFMVVVLARC